MEEGADEHVNVYWTGDREEGKGERQRERKTMLHGRKSLVIAVRQLSQTYTVSQKKRQ